MARQSWYSVWHGKAGQGLAWSGRLQKEERSIVWEYISGKKEQGLVRMLEK